MGKWLSPMKAAVYADCSINYLKPCLDSGELKSYRKPWNRTYRLVNTDDIDAWIRTWESGAKPRPTEAE